MASPARKAGEDDEFADLDQFLIHSGEHNTHSPLQNESNLLEGMHPASPMVSSVRSSREIDVMKEEISRLKSEIKQVREREASPMKRIVLRSPDRAERMRRESSEQDFVLPSRSRIESDDGADVEIEPAYLRSPPRSPIKSPPKSSPKRPFPQNSARGVRVSGLESLDDNDDDEEWRKYVQTRHDLSQSSLGTNNSLRQSPQPKQASKKDSSVQYEAAQPPAQTSPMEAPPAVQTESPPAAAGSSVSAVQAKTSSGPSSSASNDEVESLRAQLKEAHAHIQKLEYTVQLQDDLVQTLREQKRAFKVAMQDKFTHEINKFHRTLELRQREFDGRYERALAQIDALLTGEQKKRKSLVSRIVSLQQQKKDLDDYLLRSAEEMLASGPPVRSPKELRLRLMRLRSEKVRRIPDDSLRKVMLDLCKLLDVYDVAALPTALHRTLDIVDELLGIVPLAGSAQQLDRNGSASARS